MSPLMPLLGQRYILFNGVLGIHFVPLLRPFILRAIPVEFV